MKIYRFFIAIVIVMTGMNALAGNIDPETAARVGLNFWKAHADEKLVPAASGAKIVKTYSITEENQVLLYVFDIQPNGFVIVSANEAMTPVVGLSYEGYYHMDNQPENFSGFLNEYKQQSRWAMENKLQPTAQKRSEWVYYMTNDRLPEVKAGEKAVNPLCTTKWDQGLNYNYMCPAHSAGPGGHCYAGCVATAMSQVMKYWNWPDVGVGNHSYTHPFYGVISEDFSQTTYDWENMSNTINSTSKVPIATLMYHCGVAVDMNYSPLGSGSFTTLVPNALKDFFHYRSTIKIVDKSDYTWQAWKMMIKENLDDGMPMVYSGSGTGGGHAWVCDGYTDTAHFHMNFGWGGYNNGYYALDNISSFPNGHEAVLNIIPYFAPYCQSSRVYTEQTRAFGDGSIYSFYWNNTDCSWLIQPDDAIGISLAFTQFDTETGKDVVSVYDGATTAAPLLGSFSGQNLPPVLTSSGGSMLIVFNSDGTNQYQGWEALYTAIPSAIEDVDFSSILIYPNPADGLIRVHFGVKQDSEVLINITSLSGQKVLEQVIPASQPDANINVSHLQSGMYFLTVKGEQGSTCRKVAIR